MARANRKAGHCKSRTILVFRRKSDRSIEFPGEWAGEAEFTIGRTTSSQPASASCSRFDLLAFDSRRRIRIGEMTVVFWAETMVDERIASEAERLLSAAMADPPADAQAASAVDASAGARAG